MRLRNYVKDGVEIVEDRAAEVGDGDRADVGPGVGSLRDVGIEQLPLELTRRLRSRLGNVLTKKKIEENSVTVSARIRIVPSTSETARFPRSDRERVRRRCFD